MPGKFVTVSTFKTPIEAQLARSKLSSEGIETFLADENSARIDWFLTTALGAVAVQVRESDLTRANDILNRETPAEEFPEGVLDERAFCPKCGSDSVSFTQMNRSMFVLSMLVPLPLPIFRRKWTCQKCTHQWK